jgi:hypothetical protein
MPAPGSRNNEQPVTDAYPSYSSKGPFVSVTPARRRRTYVPILVLSTLAVVVIVTLSVWSRTPYQLGALAMPDQPPIAVFGLEHKLSSTATRARSSPTAASTAVARSPSDKIPLDLESTLRRCLRTIETACYAPVLESFQHQRRIPRTKVIEQRRRLLELYPRTNKYVISNLRLESLQPGRAVVSFDKEWDMVGARRYAGSASERLAAVKTRVGWQIILQDEQQLYWTKRG